MKNKTTQGLGNRNLLSFPKHDSFEYWRLKSNNNSHTVCQNNMQINQSHYLDHFSGDKWCLQRKYIIMQTTWNFGLWKWHKQLSNSCHRGGKGHVWQLWQVFRQGGYLFFNCYLRLGKNWRLFSGWISKIFTKKNISLRCHPRHK
jgi:hypothetical protein